MCVCVCVCVHVSQNDSAFKLPPSFLEKNNFGDQTNIQILPKIVAKHSLGIQLYSQIMIEVFSDFSAANYLSSIPFLRR